MNGVGFLNLPSWHEALREQLKKLGKEKLLSVPVLEAEGFDPPWSSISSDDFFSVVETGFHFSEKQITSKETKNLITAVAGFAEERLFQKNNSLTGIRGSIGGCFPMVELCEGNSYLPPFQRLLAITDGVLSFILSEMESSGTSIEDSLREAQWQGVAPGNPIQHIHGLIFRQRFSLLASRIFGIRLPSEQIPVEGISKISREDVAIAQENKFSIRMLGVLERKPDDSFQAWIGPCLLPNRYLLAQIRGGMEAAYLQFSDKTSMVFSGPGTSKEVITRGMLRDLDQLVSQGNFGIPEFRHAPLLASEAHGFNYYLRISLIDFASTLAKISQVFAESGIEIKSISQRSTKHQLVPEPDVSEIVLFTKNCLEKNLKTALGKIHQDVKLAGLKACFPYEP